MDIPLEEYHVLKLGSQPKQTITIYFGEGDVFWVHHPNIIDVARVVDRIEYVVEKLKEEYDI